MPQYSVGQSIKSARERKRLPKSILCDGICSKESDRVINTLLLEENELFIKKYANAFYDFK